ncbi:MAG TPA: GNAT family N-acetyltransferase [Nevskiaceae bacterium]|nr:GNAT family N-acetyltransferase [Nevskiaceae bacterium]
MQLIDVTDAQGELREPLWLARSEPLHRQLRPQLPPDYGPAMAAVFAGGGRLLLAVEGERALGLAVWRCLVNTHAGRHVYVDDLVTDSHRRSQGIGRELIAGLEVRARRLGASALTLDSGTQRKSAHRFYLRERFEITAFHFHKSL